jgi:hypothetical protein
VSTQRSEVLEIAGLSIITHTNYLYACVQQWAEQGYKGQFLRDIITSSEIAMNRHLTSNDSWKVLILFEPAMICVCARIVNCLHVINECNIVLCDYASLTYSLA